MTGQKSLKLEDVNTQFKQLEEKLTTFETRVGVPKVQVVNDVDRYLNLSSEQLKDLSLDECADACYILEQRSFYIQREQNRLKTYQLWADAKLRKAVAANNEQFKAKYVNFEEKRSIVALPENDEALCKLEQMRVEATIKIQDLDGISQKMQSISKVILEVWRNKRYGKSDG